MGGYRYEKSKHSCSMYGFHDSIQNQSQFDAEIARLEKEVAKASVSCYWNTQIVLKQLNLSNDSVVTLWDFWFIRVVVTHEWRIMMCTEQQS